MTNSLPKISLQSILVLNGVMGRKKTLTYVSLEAVFSTLAGLSLRIVHACLDVTIE